METPSGSSSTGKQRKREDVSSGIDCISQLPDVILLYILSFLPTKDIMVVSLVSRLWKNMVMNHLSAVPSSLNLNELEMVEKFIAQRVPHPIADFHGSQFQTYLINVAKRQYMDFVTRALMLHTGCTIENLHICLCYDGSERYTKKIRSWVRFSFSNKIKVLSLDFSSGDIITAVTSAQHYELPNSGFSPRLLHSLTLTYCTVKEVTFGVMLSLHKLKLKQVKIYDGSFGELVSKCPLLEEVHLVQCIFPDEFMVYDQDLKIKKLVIVDCRSNELPMFTIDISAPELLSLIFIARFLMTSSIKNATKLENATIDVIQLYADHVQGDALASLLDGLDHCNTIWLHSWCIQVLPTGEDMLEQLPAQLTHVEHLKLTTGLGKQELPGIACLIRSCPNLKIVTLNIEESIVVDWAEFEEDIPEILDFEEETYWLSQELPFQCMDTTLKQVTINGFQSKEKEMAVARFFLDNAAVLEKMDLYYDADNISACDATEEQLETMWFPINNHPLPTTPRLSNRAQVKVFRHHELIHG